jgi:hypothetical protein
LIGVDPNPALHESVLTVFSAGEKQIALQLTDATGRIILNRNISLSDGMNTIPLFENQKPGAGVYFLKAGDHSFSEMLRIVIL